MAHAFDHPNASLSEGEVLAVVVQVVPGNPYWKRIGKDSPNPLRQSVVRRRPASHGASWRRTGGGGSGGSDPPLFGAGAPPGRGKWSTLRSTTYPAPRGGRSLHSDPCGKAAEPVRKSAPRTVKPGGGRGDGSSPGCHRGGPGACGPEPGRGGLCPLGPVRAPAYPDGRLGRLPQRPLSFAVDHPGVHRRGCVLAQAVHRWIGPAKRDRHKPVEVAGGVENPLTPDRPAACSPEGSPPLLGRARPAHSLHRHDGGLPEYTIDVLPLSVSARHRNSSNFRQYNLPCHPGPHGPVTIRWVLADQRSLNRNTSRPGGSGYGCSSKSTGPRR